MARRKASILPINRAPDSTRPFTITDDEWLRRATAGAIAQMRKVLATLPAGTPVSAISDHEFGWMVAAALFGWVATRSEQAATEGLSVEEALRVTNLDPDPWDVGAVTAILPRLGETRGLDWSKPLSGWSRDEIVSFVLAAIALACEAKAARDYTEENTTPSVNHFDPNARESTRENPNDPFPPPFAEDIGLLP